MDGKGYVMVRLLMPEEKHEEDVRINIKKEMQKTFKGWFKYLFKTTGHLIKHRKPFAWKVKGI